ncbi:MAG: D-2-hydroxyacid dehydrogenase [Candidatus Sungiibacteriota bacterium]
MKILILRREEQPFFITPTHIHALKRAAPRAAIVVAKSTTEINRHSADADVIAGFPWQIPPLVARAKNLKWIHSFSAGVDRLLSPEIVASPIILSNSSGIHAVPIAEHIIGFMLLFMRGFYDSFRNQTLRVWKKKNDISELRGKIVLIAGFGDIGREAARLAHAFGCQVLAVSRTGKNKPEYVAELKTADKMSQMLPQADFVVIAAPYTKETHHWFAMAEFRRMKKSAVLINIARGAIVNEKDLIAALRKKLIAGAGLDVTE